MQLFKLSIGLSLIGMVLDLLSHDFDLISFASDFDFELLVGHFDLISNQKQVV